MLRRFLFVYPIIGFLAVIAGFFPTNLVCSAANAQQTFGEGVKGWETVQSNAPDIFLPDPYSACYAQWKSFMPNATASRFLGAFRGASPYGYSCAWTDWHWGCSSGACGFILPSSVWLVCLPGYHHAGYSRCERNAESAPAKNLCQAADKTPNPSVGNPIVVLDGAKVENVTDYANEDGRFSIGRHYRSFPSMSTWEIWGPAESMANVIANNNDILGAVGGWRLAI